MNLEKIKRKLNFKNNLKKKDSLLEKYSVKVYFEN